MWDAPSNALESSSIILPLSTAPERCWQTFGNWFTILPNSAQVMMSYAFKCYNWSRGFQVNISSWSDLSKAAEDGLSIKWLLGQWPCIFGFEFMSSHAIDPWVDINLTADYVGNQRPNTESESEFQFEGQVKLSQVRFSSRKCSHPWRITFLSVSPCLWNVARVLWRYDLPKNFWAAFPNWSHAPAETTA